MREVDSLERANSEDPASMRPPRAFGSRLEAQARVGEDVVAKYRQSRKMMERLSMFQRSVEVPCSAGPLPLINHCERRMKRGKRLLGEGQKVVGRQYTQFAKSGAKIKARNPISEAQPIMKYLYFNPLRQIFLSARRPVSEHWID
jgi:hypothetical protein